ncbi:unnamed protein product, partial [Prorocentrum cordatum]
ADREFNLARGSCDQSYGDIDRGSPNQSVIKSTKGNTSKDGKWKPTGRQCDDCRLNRRKHHKDPETGYPTTLDRMIAKRKDLKMNDNTQSDRSAPVRGDTRMGSMDFKEGYAEGCFYKLFDYARLLDPNEEFGGWTSQQVIEWMGGDYPGAEILQDSLGNLGVKEQDMPQGAAYKDREGTSDTKSFRQISKFEAGAEDVAAAAFQELQHGEVEPGDADEPTPAGPAPSRPPVAPLSLAPRPQRRRLARLDAHQGDASSSASGAPVPEQRADFQQGAPSLKGVHRAKSLGVGIGKVSRPDDARSDAGSAVADDGDAMGESKKMSALKSQLRSHSMEKVMGACKGILSATSDKHANSKICGRPPPPRDRTLTSPVDLLARASNRCSRLKAGDGDGQGEDAVAGMAQNLLDEAERLRFVGQLFKEARHDPVAFWNRSLHVAEKTIIQKMAPKLASNVFVAAGAGAVSKVELAGLASAYAPAVAAARAIMRFAASKDDDSMSCSFLPESSRDRVQQTVVMELVEKTLAASSDDFQSTRAALVDAGAPAETQNSFWLRGAADLVSAGLRGLEHRRVFLWFAEARRQREPPARRRRQGRVGEEVRDQLEAPSFLEQEGQAQPARRLLLGTVGQVAALGNDLQSAAARFKGLWSEFRDIRLPVDNYEDTLFLVGGFIDEGQSVKILDAVQLRANIDSETQSQDLDATIAKARFTKLMNDLEEVIEGTAGEALTPHVIDRMLEPPPTGGHGHEADRHWAADTFRCMMQLVIFRDNLESALDRGRPWSKLMLEFRARLSLLVDVSQAAVCENDKNYLGALRTWSSLWVRQQRIAITDVSLGARRSEAMNALTVLRSSSIEVAATRAFKNVLDFRKGLDDGRHHPVGHPAA